MKKLLLATMLLGFSLILVGCGKNTSSISWDEQQVVATDQYKNKEKWFSLTFPRDWTFKENVYGSLVMFFSPVKEKSDVRENFGVAVQKLKAWTSILDSYGAFKKNLSYRMKDFWITTEEDIKNWGENGKKIIYQVKEGDYKIKFEQIFFQKNQELYILTYTALNNTFDDYLPTVDGIIASFWF